MTIADAKAHEEKISAQLHEAKALIEEFEAHAKKNTAEAKIEKINALKAKREEIEKKLHQLLKVGVDAKVAEKMKDDIVAEMGKLKTSIEEFATKHKS